MLVIGDDYHWDFDNDKFATIFVKMAMFVTMIYN